MKKVKSQSRKAAKKSRTAAKSVDEYLAGVPEPARGTLNQVRETIRSAAPKESTEIISYGIPAFKYRGVLIWYAAFADHCSLFPTAAVIETFKRKLKSYTISKGTIQFALDKPRPAPLVRKMVKAPSRADGKQGATLTSASSCSSMTACAVHVLQPKRYNIYRIARKLA